MLGELEAGGSVSTTTRRYLARKAFAHTATYDAAVWSWLRAADEDNELPTRYPIGLRLRETLRYGENPHQRAGLYTLAGGTGDTVVGAQLHQGKELSFNNLADADAALECEIKAAVVAADEEERGLRAILNFGHTFGREARRGGQVVRPRVPPAPSRGTTEGADGAEVPF